MDTLPTIYTIIGVIWLYHTLSFFFVNRSTSLLSQFSACCWPVAIHRSLLDLTRSRWLHQECSAHHGNLRPAGNAMRTTCAMIDLFRTAEISICLDIEKHICIYILYIYTIYIIYIYTYSICIWLDVNACMSFFPFCKWKQLRNSCESTPRDAGTSLGCWIEVRYHFTGRFSLFRFRLPLF